MSRHAGAGSGAGVRASAGASAAYDLSEALRVARLKGARWATIIEEDRRTDVAALDSAATAGAEAIARAGLRPGARVGLRVQNTAPHIAAMFAVWRAAAILVPLNPRLTDGEAESLLDHAEAAATLEVGRTASIEVRSRGETPGSHASGTPRASDVRRAAEAGESSQGVDPGASNVAVIAYTSGTTGRPKGVVLTHTNLLWAAAAVMGTRRDRPTSVAAVVSPLCHLPIFVSHYLARLLSGGTIILGTYDIERVVRMLRDQGVTDLPLVPAMVGPLLAVPNLGRCEQLAKVTVGSAFTAMEVKQQLTERFPSAEILEAYGQTESTDGLTMTVGREALDRPGTVGRAHAQFALGIRASDGQLLDPVLAASSGAAGEIVARGPTVMQGYLKDDEATRATLRDGWLHTGDLGRLDADGYLYITGRLKEIIITGGENVSPEEIESVLARHPAVAEVAIYGAPHERWGEQVTAAVVGRAPVSAEELVEFARPHLARFKLPREIRFVDALPKTSAGKVKRRELREIHVGEHSEDATKV